MNNMYYVVAGANGAIGKQVCHRILAKGGIPILMGRCPMKLQQTKDELLLLSSSSSLPLPKADIPIVSGIDLQYPNELSNQLLNNSTCPDYVHLYPSIRGFVYAVGSITIKPFKACTVQDYMTSYNINVVGAIELLKLHMKQLKKESTLLNPGSIVFYSSVAVQHGFNNHSVISCSKGAIEGLTKALANELCTSNIRVNCIAPSLTTESTMGLSMTTNEKMAVSIANAHPIQRLGSPNDSAAATMFLLNNHDSSWVTGTILPVDGGRSTILK